MAEILYRKWRPRSFAELFGQEHVATTLTNALASGRVAHAYLFAGPRGTGKTSTGRLLGKALNCTNRQGGEPCNECESCLSFLAGRAMDLIELDAASNRGIDEIRSLRDKVAFAPGAGAFKIYLIDEVHMLTEAAFNALLKTLEEPPPHVVFMLATTEAHKVPATIASRCQRFDFRRAPLASMVKNLERICEGENLSCEPAALELIARSATGSHRDAVNLLDQLATSYGSDLTVEHVRTGLGLIGDERSGRLARLVLDGDLAGGLTLIASVRDDGLDLRQFQRELVAELRALLMAKSGLPPEEGATEERRRDLKAVVSGVETSRILIALRAFGEADLKPDPNSTLPLDIALAECALAGGQAGRLADRQEDTRQSGSRAIGQSPTRPSLGSTGGREASTPARPELVEGTLERPAEDAPQTGEGPAAASKSVRSSTPSETIAPPETAVGAARPAPPEASISDISKSGSSVRPSTNSGRTETVPVAAEGEAKTPGNGSVGQLEAAKLRENMRQVYQRARAMSPTLGALLNSGCDIIKVDEREAIFGFRFSNHATKAAEKVNLDMLTTVVADLTGMQLVVSCRHEEGLSGWQQRETASRSALVRAAQELGARVISDEPEDQP